MVPVRSFRTFAVIAGMVITTASFPLPARGDVVILDRPNANRVEGRILEETDQTVRIRRGDGIVLEYSRSMVKSVEKTDTSEEPQAGPPEVNVHIANYQTFRTSGGLVDVALNLEWSNPDKVPEGCTPWVVAAFPKKDASGRGFEVDMKALTGFFDSQQDSEVASLLSPIMGLPGGSGEGAPSAAAADGLLQDYLAERKADPALDIPIDVNGYLSWISRILGEFRTELQEQLKTIPPEVKAMMEGEGATGLDMPSPDEMLEGLPENLSVEWAIQELRKYGRAHPGLQSIDMVQVETILRRIGNTIYVFEPIDPAQGLPTKYTRTNLGRYIRGQGEVEVSIVCPNYQWLVKEIEIQEEMGRGPMDIALNTVLKNQPNVDRTLATFAPISETLRIHMNLP